MILNASQRGGGAELGAHLLKTENEHVELHELRGFTSSTVAGAMKEIQAVAKGTKCRQYLFSVSLSPPETERVPVGVFERAIEKIAEATGLDEQPRIVIFHEKEGRRHCHAVFSRIDAATMTAVPLPFFKMKLREISRGIYFEQGWRLPRGLMDSKERDPRNFSLAEWQQARRMGADPRQLKAAIQECWSVSDSHASFEVALEERGLYLACGDRRGFVALTYEGEAVPITRATGRKASEVRARLGAPADARSVGDTRAHIAAVITPRLASLLRQEREAARLKARPLIERRNRMTEQHRSERTRLEHRQHEREAAETRHRSSRLRRGLEGVWDRLTGRRAEIEREIARDGLACLRRDRAQRDDLVATQLAERRTLQREIRLGREQQARSLLSLYRDIARQRGATAGSRDTLAGTPSRNAGHETVGDARGKTGRDPRVPRGPDLGR